METAKKEKIRPYWHVDAKWVFGILTTLFLSISLILFILSSLTSEKNAVPIATLIVAGQFSKDGLDDPKDIEETKKKYLNSNENVFYPLGGQEVSITRTDLETLSPREIRLKIFRQIVEPYYYEGAEGVAERVGKTPEQREEIKKQAGLLAFLNKQTHELIFRIFLISVIPIAFTISGLVYFSYKYGRLISPAVVFLYLGTIPAIILFLISIFKPPLDAQGRSEGIPFLPYEIIQQVAAAIAPPFYLLFITGIGLILATIILRLIKSK